MFKSPKRWVMALDLVYHPDCPPRGVKGVRVRWYMARGNRFLLRWLVNGVDALDLPGFAGKGRADDLWRETCFELFLQDQTSARYAEFNFSPSGRWAAYLFGSYRAERTDLEPVHPPEITSDRGQFLYTFNAMIDGTLLEGVGGASVTAVIAEKDGTRSFWAPAHPPGRPDFHDPACFAVKLPAPDA
jgi:hypothetical protein